MVPEAEDEGLHAFMIGADGDAVAKDKVSGDVDDGLGHRVFAGGFEGVAVELVDLAEVAVVGLGAEGGPAGFCVVDAGADGGQESSQFVGHHEQRR